MPTNANGQLSGVARGPVVLRECGLVPALLEVTDLTDSGDLPLPLPTAVRGPSGLLAEDALCVMIERVRDSVVKCLQARRFPLLVGGDCPVILGALAALQTYGKPFGLAFFDGHEDAWPPDKSPMGEASDSELGLALRMFDRDLDPQLLSVLPRVLPKQVAAIGPRDSEELAQAKVESLAGRLSVLIRPGDGPFDRLLSQARRALAELPRPWWLHVDLDVLASTELTAVDYPQPGGLTWEQLQTLSRMALGTTGCAGWSVCIYNPDLDAERLGARRIIRYMADCVTALAD